MPLTSRGVAHESEVLVRQMDGRLATLRAGDRCRTVPPNAGAAGATPPGADDLQMAERMAENLRRLIADTNHSCAVERARVRAAVHYFIGLRNTRRRAIRTLPEQIRVLNDMVRDLNRHDLVVEPLRTAA